MKNRLFSTLLCIAIIASMIGTALPATPASAKSVLSFPSRIDISSSAEIAKPDLTVPSILNQWVNEGTGVYNVQFTIVNNSLTPAPASVARFSVDGALNAAVINVPALAATGTISGHVYEANGTTPISGATVNIVTAIYQPPVRVLTSGLDGSYSVTDLADGSYYVWAAAPGRAQQFWNHTPFGRTATAVAVTAASPANGIDFNLVPGGTLAGSVTSGGVPVPNLKLKVVDINNADNWWIPITGTTGESNGVYRINVPNGTYKVYAPWEDDPAAAAYVKKYYNDKADVTSADTVAIASPAGATGINFYLAAAGAGGTISGHIYETNGTTPISGATVMVRYSNSLPGQAAVATTQTDVNGGYSVSGLDGSYKVLASALNHATKFWPNGITFLQGLIITVTPTIGAANININLDPGATLGGKVTNAAGDPLANISVYIKNTADASLNWRLITNATGDYRTNLPGGNYKLYAPAGIGSADPGYTVEYYNDKADEGSADTVVLVNGVNNTSINFSLIAASAPGSTISGHVYDRPISGSATPVSGATVCIREFSATGPALKSATTQADGSYTITEVPTGSYRVWAFAGGRATRFWEDVLFMPSATSVAVSDTQGALGIDFHLEPGGPISGKVTAQADGSDLANISVAITNVLDTSVAWITLTNATGNYGPINLPYGNYTVRAPSGRGVGAADSGYFTKYYNNKISQSSADVVNIASAAGATGINFNLAPGGGISGRVTDQQTGEVPVDAANGSVTLSAGWHKLVYRFFEVAGGQAAKAAFKAPGDSSWRALDTAELALKVAPDGGAAAGITLTNKKNTWTNYPSNHSEMVKCVNVDSTTEAGWYGQGVVTGINQTENIYGNDEQYTSFYETYFNVTTPGLWSFSTDSDDGSEILIDDNLVAYWYQGHPVMNRWELKGTVTISTTGGEWIADVLYDDQGYYSFSGLAPSNYKLSARVPGFFNEYYLNQNNFASATQVAVTAGVITPNVNFTLDKASYISGRVYDDAEPAVPIAGATVNIYPLPFNPPPLTTAITDQAGYYYISPLAEGSYNVMSSAVGRAQQFWDHTPFGRTATAVPVTSASPANGIDFNLVPGGTLAGSVTSGGVPVPNLKLKVVDINNADNWWVPITGTTGESNGVYRINVPTGTYKVYAPFEDDPAAAAYVKKYYNDKADVTSADTVAIASPAGATGINFYLAAAGAGGTISGHIYETNGTTPISGATVMVRDPNSLPGQPFAATTTTDVNGSYSVSGLDGSYKVAAVAPNRAHKYWPNGITFLQGRIVTVTPTTGAANININLDPGATLGGKVTNAAGDPLANISVYIKNTADASLNWRLITNATGDYRTNLVGGSYKLYAPAGVGSADPGYTVEYYNNKADEASADTVVLVNGVNNTTIDFSLVAASAAATAGISVLPSTQTVGIGQVFTVDIMVDASNQAVDTVEAYLNFTPAYLQVVNNAGEVLVGVVNDAIQPGAITTTNLTAKLKNQIDNTNGKADIGYGIPPLGTPANSKFLFGTIRFKALQETTEPTALTFNVTGLRTTAAILAFTPVTGAINNGTVTIASSVAANLKVALQGRPAAPHAQWIIPVKVWLHAPGAAWVVDDNDSIPNGSILYFETQTNNEGRIAILAPPGTYDIRVKGLTTLKNKVQDVLVEAGMGEVNAGLLLEGDVNGDNMVTGLDYSAVIMCFGYEVADVSAPAPTPRCDFNNDGYVTGMDYSAVVMNFGQGGADIE